MFGGDPKIQSKIALKTTSQVCPLVNRFLASRKSLLLLVTYFLFEQLTHSQVVFWIPFFCPDQFSVDVDTPSGDVDKLFSVMDCVEHVQERSWGNVVNAITSFQPSQLLKFLKVLW